MRFLLPLLLTLIATGCNTCLNPESVSLADDATTYTDATEDAGDDTALDLSSQDLGTDLRTMDFGPTDAGGDVSDLGTPDTGPDADMSPPADLGQDACVPESTGAFCDRLAAECGAVSGRDNCAMPRTVDCGSCGSNGSCANQICVCDDGYTDANNGCRDIDECANGTDDCDPNATCTNLPGSFDCACDDGFVGDGRTCERPPLVKSVFFETATMSGLQHTVSTPAFDPAKTVPFMSIRTDSSLIEGRLVDIELPGSGLMELQRAQFGGFTWANVFGVEFDHARVETGRFTLSGPSVTVPFSSTVDPSRAFLVTTVRAVTNDIDTVDEYMLHVSFDANGLTVSRQGGPGDLVGSWWLVEATYEHFSAQHVDLSLSNLQNCRTATISNVDMDRSFLNYSAKYVGADFVSSAQIRCELTSSTEVECCRLTTAGANTVDARISVVTFAPWTTGSVQRGLETMASASTQSTLGISQVPLADSMVWLGRFAPMSPSASAPGNSATDDEHGYVSGKFRNDTSFILEREVPSTADAQVSWEVVVWPD